MDNIVGNGQAGIQLVDSLRTEGYTGRITVIGEEAHFPYQRPPLSKDYMSDAKTPLPLPLRAERFFAGNDVDSRLGVRVTAVDRARRTATLDDGSRLVYSKLVLATGAANRELSVPGSGLAGIHGLRTLSDAEAVHARLAVARSVVVIGAGFIGLEFAAAARQRGLDVTVLEFADRPMGRALSPAMSGYFAGAHERMGVQLRFGEGIASFEGRDGHVCSAVSTAGHSYPADLVLVGIGVIPRTERPRQPGCRWTTGSSWMAPCAPRTRTSSPLGTAPATPAAMPPPAPGWSQCRTPRIRPAIWPGPSWEAARATPSCPGSGPSRAR
ncbi:MAG: FAD/NAD(P)-binding oxidoreductase [Arthrobacter sp.]|nr:FAD/NAD(P)-binding oxidoreductase [Arthrobacter sp.]